MTQTEGFLISRQWYDTPSGITLRYWLATDSGPLLLEQTNQQGIFFVEQDAEQDALTLIGRKVAHHKPLKLNSFKHKPVVGFYFNQQQKLRQSALALKQNEIEPYEYDVRTVDRYLMERFINASVAVEYSEHQKFGRYNFVQNARLTSSQYRPRLKVVSFDIETAIYDEQIYSIAVYAEAIKHVFMVSDHPLEHGSHYPNERSLIKAFLSWIEQYDPDILIGWNCINFDLRYLERSCKRLNLRFELGRDREVIEWRTSPNNEDHYFALIPGRAIIDGIDMLKMATYHFESFSLEFVAHELLGKGKLIHNPEDRGDEITRLFLEDKQALANYNLEDCALVWEIFEKTDLIQFSIERANMTGLPIDKIGGSVAAFENQYLPRLHRQGYVAPNIPENPIGVGSPGGYVMNSKPGLYEHVLVLDFKSLYPSIIRSFQVDPYALAEGDRLINPVQSGTVNRSVFSEGFNGAFFKKKNSILPGLIEHLWQARDDAKRVNNPALSQAIKIIMNSFYGVMGTPGCRFFDRRLPSSITLRGHEIMNQTRTLIEQQGYDVIYGDTDSIFVWLNQSVSESHANDIGNQLASYITSWWKNNLEQTYDLTSALELEFENHYTRFLMPTIRGSSEGSKKRYAGLVCAAEFSFQSPKDSDYTLVFKGLETVRTDWTLLAREFQRELYKRIFLELSYEDYIKQLVEDIRAGKHDDKLIYRKRLRRKLSEYQRNIPPHAQAAQKADDWLISQGKKAKYHRGGWIEYAYTVNGAEPVEHITSKLDYELYIERQIAPITDGILSFKNTSFKALLDNQISLL